MQPTPALLARLVAAVAHRDLDEIAGCFAQDYRNETPVHPARGFVGRSQVRRNWEQILAAVPDLVARVEQWTQDGSTIWTEWTQRGTRPDGTAFEMRGVVLFELAGQEFGAARFYLEPVDRGDERVDATVRRQVGGQP